jgi:hypothetical protein
VFSVRWDRHGRGAFESAGSNGKKATQGWQREPLERQMLAWACSPQILRSTSKGLILRAMATAMLSLQSLQICLIACRFSGAAKKTSTTLAQHREDRQNVSPLCQHYDVPITPIESIASRSKTLDR